LQRDTCTSGAHAAIAGSWKHAFRQRLLRSFYSDGPLLQQPD